MSATCMFSHAGDAESCEHEVPSPSTLPACQDIRFPRRRLTRWRMLDVLELQVRETLRTRFRTEPPLVDEVLSLGEHPISGAAVGHLSLCRRAGCSGWTSITKQRREFSRSPEGPS